MSKVRIYGDTSGYVDIAVPAVAGTTTLNLDKIPQADINGNIAMDTNTLYVDAANNRVGVGTASPNTALDIVSPSSAEAINIRGRSADDIGQLKFYENDGTTSLARLDSRTTHFEVGSYNELRFSAGGVGNSHVVIDTSGNVGIGTQSPAGKLNVVSTAHNNGAIFDSTGTTQLWLRDTDATSNQRNWGFQISGGDFNIIRANDDRASGFVTPIYMQQAPSNSLVINSSGHVGFGHGSPSAPIDVVTNSVVYAAEFTQSNTSNGDGVLISVGSTAAADYALTVRSDAGNTSVLAAKADGKVGIGTFTPDKTLTVRGTSGDVVQAKIIYAGADGNRSGLILQNTHTGGREYGLYVGNNSTGGGLGNSFGISDNTAGTAYRLLINSDGDIGMGVAPYSDAKLTLGGTDSGGYPSVLMFDNNNSSGAEFFMLATDTNWSAGSNKFIMGHGTPGSGNMDVTIDSAGNVGIGTYNPSVNLEVNASGNTFILVKDRSSGSGLYFKAASGGAAEIQTAGGSNTMGFRTSGQERVHISSAGYVTMPNLPSFSAVYNGSTWTTSGGSTMIHNHTGTGGHNTGNHYSTSTGRFTAPVAGVYYFSWYSICSGTYNNAYIQFYKNGGRMYGGDIHITKDEGGWDTYNWNRTIYLSLGDYIEPKQQGTMTWHGNHWNHFGGFLVG